MQRTNSECGFPYLAFTLFHCFTGCRVAIALIRDSRTHQDGFCREYGVPPLVRLLRGSRTALKTLLSVIKALGCLCIGNISHFFHCFFFFFWVYKALCYSANDKTFVLWLQEWRSLIIKTVKRLFTEKRPFLHY